MAQRPEQTTHCTDHEHRIVQRGEPDTAVMICMRCGELTSEADNDNYPLLGDVIDEYTITVGRYAILRGRNQASAKVAAARVADYVARCCANEGWFHGCLVIGKPGGPIEHGPMLLDEPAPVIPDAYLVIGHEVWETAVHNAFLKARQG